MEKIQENKFFEIFLSNGKVLKIKGILLGEENNILKILEYGTGKVYIIREFINIIISHKNNKSNNLFENIEEEKF